MEKIVTEFLIELLSFLNIDQKKSALVEIDFSEEIKRLIIDKLKIIHIQDSFIDRSSRTDIVGVEWSGDINGFPLIVSSKGKWSIVSIKNGDKIIIKPLTVLEYLNNPQNGNIFLY